MADIKTLYKTAFLIAIGATIAATIKYFYP
jgi:hypothetical protein